MVSFHAHPDDECISCGGVMRAAADAGHRVVLVVATRGEHGEIVPGVLVDGETLAERRVKETHDAAAVLGIARVEFLGYVDSGMVDTDTNGASGSFWSADVEEAAERLAAILRDEDAEVLTCYDRIGGYGHPDHIQVHRVGVRAAEIAGVERVLEGTINRTALRRMVEARASGDVELPEGVELPNIEEVTFGVEEDRITHLADVSAVALAKRTALLEHRSQVADDHFFLALPEDAFIGAFGTEWFIGHGPLDDDRSPVKGIVVPFTPASA